MNGWVETVDIRRAGLRALGLCVASGIWLAACNAGPPHQHQPDPQARSPEHTDRLLPPTTYWTGLLFKGAKIGFSRFAIAPRDNGGYEIRTETTMRFRFLTVDKSIAVRAVDLVAPDLALRRFHYRYELDGSRLELRGTVREGQLEVEITNAGVASHQSHPLRDKLYPTSVATLYPMVHGIEPGREFAYSVYDGETRSISQLRQTIVGFEFGDRFDGSALRLETWLHGQRTTTWLDTGDTPRAGPVLETTLGGALVARREEPDTARAYLASAAVDARGRPLRLQQRPHPRRRAISAPDRDPGSPILGLRRLCGALGREATMPRSRGAGALHHRRKRSARTASRRRLRTLP